MILNDVPVSELITTEMKVREVFILTGIKAQITPSPELCLPQPKSLQGWSP